MKISDRILYAQILSKAGYIVTEITEVRGHRGQGVFVEGTFTRFGEPVTRPIDVTPGANDVGEYFAINGQRHYVTVRPDGSFDLFVAHGDRPR